MEQERISITLKKSTPSTITAESLRRQLHQIGLHCEQTSVENLQHYLDGVMDNLPYGSLQGVAMCEPAETSGETTMTADQLLPISNIQNSWEPSDFNPYKNRLSVVGIADNFDILHRYYPGFQGKKSMKHIQKNDCTEDAFKQLFIQIAMGISETLNGDLDRKQVETVFATIIQPIKLDSNDYDSGLQNRMIYFIDDYDPGLYSCEGVGVINLEFRIIVQNYKNKNEHHNYFLDITVRSSFYRDLFKLSAELDFIRMHDRKNCTGQNWMEKISGDKLLSQINIPGTHDCATANLSKDKIKQFQCQYLSVYEQMKIGVRYFDIRCKSKKGYNDAQFIYHDSVPCLNQCGNHISLDELIRVGKTFLNAHPSETLLFQIKNEDHDDNDERICNYLGEYIKNGSIWTGSKIPRLRDVRGRIVLVRRFTVKKNKYHYTEKQFGIDLSSWDSECSLKKNNNTFVEVKNNAWVQDRYLIGASEKQQLIGKAVAEMNDPGTHPGKEWAICLSSCTSPTPFWAADAVNEWLLSGKSPLTAGKIGTFVVDFASEALISKIYNSNF